MKYSGDATFSVEADSHFPPLCLGFEMIFFSLGNRVDSKNRYYQKIIHRSEKFYFTYFRDFFGEPCH